MDNFMYAVDNSFAFMKSEIKDVLDSSNYTEVEKNRLFCAVGTCLHSILDFAERRVFRGNNEKYVSAFRHANNTLKHSLVVKEITKTQGGVTFPIHFPLTIPKKEVVWGAGILDDPKYKNQYRNYCEFLEEKPVIETCEKIIELIKNAEMRYEH